LSLDHKKLAIYTKVLRGGMFKRSVSGVLTSPEVGVRLNVVPSINVEKSSLEIQLHSADSVEIKVIRIGTKLVNL